MHIAYYHSQLSDTRNATDTDTDTDTDTRNAQWEQQTLDELGELLDQVDDSEKLKEKLQLILKVKDAVSFKDFFGKLKSTTEKDIALALIYQATVVQILVFTKK